MDNFINNLINFILVVTLAYILFSAVRPKKYNEMMVAEQLGITVFLYRTKKAIIILAVCLIWIYSL